MVVPRWHTSGVASPRATVRISHLDDSPIDLIVASNRAYSIDGINEIPSRAVNGTKEVKGFFDKWIPKIIEVLKK